MWRQLWTTRLKGHDEAEGKTKKEKLKVMYKKQLTTLY